MLDEAGSLRSLRRLAQGQQSPCAGGLNEAAGALQVKPAGSASRGQPEPSTRVQQLFGSAGSQRGSQLLSTASLQCFELGWQRCLCNHAACLDVVCYRKQAGEDKSKFSGSLFPQFSSQRHCTDTSGSTGYQKQKREVGMTGAVRIKVYGSTVGLHHIVHL